MPDIAEVITAMIESEDFLIMALLSGILLYRATERPDPVPQHTSIRTGAMHTRELMDSRSLPHFRNHARMAKETFQALITLLKDKAGLKDSRKVSAEEKLVLPE